MERSIEPLHGIQYTPVNGWRVWSHLLQFPLQSGSAADAKRIARALEEAYPHGAAVVYTAVNRSLQPRSQPAAVSS